MDSRLLIQWCCYFYHSLNFSPERRRKRSTDEKDYNSVETVYPFLEKINKIGFEHLNDVNCQKVCELLGLFITKKLECVRSCFVKWLSWEIAKRQTLCRAPWLPWSTTHRPLLQTRLEWRRFYRWTKSSHHRPVYKYNCRQWKTKNAISSNVCKVM